jgi:hypothetical protein
MILAGCGPSSSCTRRLLRFFAWTTARESVSVSAVPHPQAPIEHLRLRSRCAPCIIFSMHPTKGGALAFSGLFSSCTCPPASSLPSGRTCLVTITFLTNLSVQVNSPALEPLSCPEAPSPENKRELRPAGRLRLTTQSYYVKTCRNGTHIVPRNRFSVGAASNVWNSRVFPSR